MAQLSEVLRNHKVTIFNEDHADADPQLIEKYQTIFKEAAKADIKDVMIELPPRAKTNIELGYQEYASYLARQSDKKIGKAKLLSLLDDPKMDTEEAKIILAAVYGMTLHPVDVGNRTEIDVIRSTVAKFSEFSKKHPDKKHKDFIVSLTKEDMDELSEMAERRITTDDMNEIVRKIMTRGMNETLKARVREGIQR